MSLVDMCTAKHMYMQPWSAVIQMIVHEPCNTAHLVSHANTQSLGIICLYKSKHTATGHHLLIQKQTHSHWSSSAYTKTSLVHILVTWQCVANLQMDSQPSTSAGVEGASPPVLGGAEAVDDPPDPVMVC